MSTPSPKKPFALASLFLLFAAFPACGGSNDAASDDAGNGANTPDPSATYCSDHAGTVEIRTEPAGQYGVCKFSGGSECDTWAFYRGECKPGDCTKWESCKLGADAGASDGAASHDGSIDGSAADSMVGPTDTCQVCVANPASTNCVDKGGNSEIRTESAGQYGVCKFRDGSECEEWAFFRGQCKPGDCTNWETCKRAVDSGAKD